MKPPPKQFKDNTDPEWSPMEEHDEINFEDEDGTLESMKTSKESAFGWRETVAQTF